MDEHLPAGIAGWKAHKRIRQQLGDTDFSAAVFDVFVARATGSRGGSHGPVQGWHRPLTRDTLWDREARLAAYAQVRTPVARDGHTADTI